MELSRFVLLTLAVGVFACGADATSPLRAVEGDQDPLAPGSPNDANGPNDPDGPAVGDEPGPPGACDTVFDPVCGIDGQTYGNACEAEQAGVPIARPGSCSAGGEACGGLLGLTCADDELCDYPDDSCGAADQTGTCQRIPDACPDVWMPVCGCDGQTYGNSCEAHAAGVDTASLGACPPPERRCGGWSGQTCGSDEYCHFDWEYCDWADGSGTCRPRPEICTDHVDPVCSCDGRTFTNRCEAQAAGVDAAYAGPCE
jgi:hypothetical protein